MFAFIPVQTVGKNKRVSTFSEYVISDINVNEGKKMKKARKNTPKKPVAKRIQKKTSCRKPRSKALEKMDTKAARAMDKTAGFEATIEELEKNIDRLMEEKEVREKTFEIEINEQKEKLKRAVEATCILRNDFIKLKETTKKGNVDAGEKRLKDELSFKSRELELEVGKRIETQKKLKEETRDKVKAEAAIAKLKGIIVIIMEGFENKDGSDGKRKGSRGRRISRSRERKSWSHDDKRRRRSASDGGWRRRK